MTIVRDRNSRGYDVRLQVARGIVALNGDELREGDEVAARSAAEPLLFDLA